jgi:Fur family ferric uptake transcriptional regulator
MNEGHHPQDPGRAKLPCSGHGRVFARLARLSPGLPGDAGRRYHPVVAARDPEPADASARTSHTETVLKKSGLRRTPVRVGVIDVLSKAPRPMTVTQILGKLKDVDTVTVYRTLNTFVRKKLIHRVRGEDRSWLYAAGNPAGNPAGAAPEHRHPHFVCESCGKVECLGDSTIPGSFVNSLKVSDEYHITYSEVVLHGLCPRCA